MSETVKVLPAYVYADMIGKPFEDGARGPQAYDCWGVLQEVLRRLGHKPTDFPSNPALLVRALSDEWEEVRVDRILPGDGILLRSMNTKYQWHIGVAVDQWNMLHAREGVGVCRERIDSPVYRSRIVGFYRYRGRG